MKLILGLGNPGAKYEHTRHNAGFDALEQTAAFFQTQLKKRCFCKYAFAEVPGGILVKPLTFMNASGNIIKHFRKYNINPCDIMVICDNMDLAAGGLRVRQGGGNGGQKGLNSIEEALGSSDWIRLFIGTGRPAEGVEVVDHVLSVETDPVKKEALQKAIADASEAVRDFLGGQTVAQLQSKYNRKGIL